MDGEDGGANSLRKELNDVNKTLSCLEIAEEFVRANCDTWDEGGTAVLGQTRVGGIKFQRGLTAFGRENTEGWQSVSWPVKSLYSHTNVHYL